jgi:hypothetical protein
MTSGTITGDWTITGDSGGVQTITGDPVEIQETLAVMMLG